MSTATAPGGKVGLAHLGDNSEGDNPWADTNFAHCQDN